MKKRKLPLFLAAVLALALVVGTLAYYTGGSYVDNRLSTPEGGDSMPEKFSPPPTWKPGEEVTKEAGVLNTGEIDLVVRVKLDEYWWRDANNNNTMEAAEQIKHIASNEKDGNDVKILVVKQPASGTGTNQVAGPLDGIIDNDSTVVTKTFAANFATKWTYNAADGYWYYNSVLKPNENAAFLASITSAADMDLGRYDTTKYYTFSETVSANKPNPDATVGQPGYINTSVNFDTGRAAADAAAANAWVIYRTPAQVAADEAAGVKFPVPNPVDPATTTYSRSVTKLVDTAQGYAGALYDLIITYDTCQATLEAVNDQWTSTPTAVKTGWNLPSNN